MYFQLCWQTASAVDDHLSWSPICLSLSYCKVTLSQSLTLFFLFAGFPFYRFLLLYAIIAMYSENNTSVCDATEHISQLVNNQVWFVWVLSLLWCPVHWDFKFWSSEEVMGALDQVTNRVQVQAPTWLSAWTGHHPGTSTLVDVNVIWLFMYLTNQTVVLVGERIHLWECIIFGNNSNYIFFREGGGINDVEWAYWDDQKLPIQIPPQEASDRFRLSENEIIF